MAVEPTRSQNSTVTVRRDVGAAPPSCAPAAIAEARVSGVRSAPCSAGHGRHASHDGRGRPRLAVSKRIGIDYAGEAKDWPLRFYDADSAAVSRR